MMKLTALLPILLLCCCLPSRVRCAGCQRRWCKYIARECLDESSAMARWNSPSLHGCVLKASAKPDDLLLQWNSQTGVCSLFSYQQVCRLVQTGGDVTAGASIASSPCSVYRAAALASCAASLNARLLGVWLAGGSSRFSNLVCQSGNTDGRLVGVNLQWTEEGARFDGVSSYALLNDSRFVPSDTSGGFTWLMRLKRQPQAQPFMEAVSCSDFTRMGRHFWEYNDAKRMYYNRGGVASDPSNFRIFTPEKYLPGDNSTWADIGISIGSSAASSSFYYGSGFVGTAVSTTEIYSPQPCYYLSIGHRFHSSYLNGVVQAVAVANGSMTEQEMRDFFGSLP